MNSRGHHKLLNEKILSPGKGSLESLDYSKVNKPFGQSFLSRENDLRKPSGVEPLVQLNSSMNHKKQHSKSKTHKDEELVKHMRNLPGYLQRVGKGDNLQEKALNVGVLDWGRLENWKSNEKCIPPRYSMKTSLPKFVESGSAGLSRTSLNKTAVHHRKSSASNGGPSNSPSKQTLSPGVRWPRGKAEEFQHSKPVTCRTSNVEETPCQKDCSPGGDYSATNSDRSNAKYADQTTMPGNETSFSDRRKHGSPHPPYHTMSAGGKAAKMMLEENISLACDHFPSERKSVTLRVFEDSPGSSCSRSFQIPDSRMAFDGKLTEANEARFYDCFSPEEFHSLNSSSEVPHSCPLPTSDETNNESECPSKGRCLDENESSMEISTTRGISKKFDQECAVQLSGKGRHPSPNKRFSFSLGKMSRSFSFNENSAVPQVSSRYTTVNSGPVQSESSSDLDNSNRKKENANSRSRSSPLRRLLDPLLKPKGAQSTEPVQPFKPNLNSTSFKHKLSSVQALLQLTFKNGIPFFKLVVDSSSDILAAAVKKMPSKDDSSLIYAFYSVHEIKKKSGGWINQGSKGKSCGFGYNIVGQMVISSSYPSKLSGHSVNNQYVMLESVLYSTGTGQGDQRTPSSTLNRELAAVVAKTPHDQVDGHAGSIRSTVVILPGGVHNFPISGGGPSPLIDRWKSGGVCDCGGWDVGCELQVLTNLEEAIKIPRPTPCSSMSRLDLCYQGGHQNKKIFSLVPLHDGLYSLEHEASISLLQAFSVCVAVVTSQKLDQVFGANNILFEDKGTAEAMTIYDKLKAPVVGQPDIAAKYVSSPPSSPYGRV